MFNNLKKNAYAAVCEPDAWHDNFNALSMFRNLFKHLEDISANTRQQQSHLSESGQWSEKISGQIEQLNLALQTRQRQSIRALRTTNLVMAGVGVSLIIFLFVYTFNLSRSTGRAMDEAADNSRTSAMAAFEHYRSIGNKEEKLEEQVSHLEALVEQQALMIAELKKLNQTAVRTFISIRKDLQQRQAAAGTPTAKQ